MSAPYESGKPAPVKVRTAIAPPRGFFRLVLVRNEGQILEHNELLDKVWKGMFVEHSNLKKSVSVLRQVLGEQANESLYIKTLPRRGYSFVASVRAVSDDTATAFYRETETQFVVEEIVEDDDESESAPDKRASLPAAETGLCKNRRRAAKLPRSPRPTPIIGAFRPTKD